MKNILGLSLYRLIKTENDWIERDPEMITLAQDNIADNVSTKEDISLSCAMDAFLKSRRLTDLFLSPLLLLEFLTMFCHVFIEKMFQKAQENHVFIEKMFQKSQGNYRTQYLKRPSLCHILKTMSAFLIAGFLRILVCPIVMLFFDGIHSIRGLLDSTLNLILSPLTAAHNVDLMWKRTASTARERGLIGDTAAWLKETVRIGFKSIKYMFTISVIGLFSPIWSLFYSFRDISHLCEDNSKPEYIPQYHEIELEGSHSSHASSKTSPHPTRHVNKRHIKKSYTSVAQPSSGGSPVISSGLAQNPQHLFNRLTPPAPTSERSMQEVSLN